jgi:DNA-binding MarR family transcriptional regulator/GNAT superfamily N-acetyltransferase
MDPEEQIDSVRAFNRFYTRRLGVLRAGLLHTRFSLSEARIIFELAQRRETTASALRAELDLDAGYLSRILRSFEEGGLLVRARSATDGRQRILRLTAKGRRAFATLNARSHKEVGAMLRGLSEENRKRLVNAMQTIQAVLAEAPPNPPFVLRPHEPGDIGWVTHRHGVLYSEEYGWDEEFEALVAAILADFVKSYDPKRERSWIAEMDGEIVGSVFVTRKDNAVAKLRLLLVEPRARGMGLGTRLVDECIRFARRAGYRKMTLYTNSCLLAARHIYEKAGFRVVKEWSHHSYGHDLVGEDWELEL